MNRKLQILEFKLISIIIVSFVGNLAIELVEGRGGDIYKSYKGSRYSPIRCIDFYSFYPVFHSASQIKHLVQ